MYKHFLKRFFDIFVSFLALPFIFLVVIIMAPIIYINDPGPIFYNAPRVGKNGKVFKMFKLRSMYVNSPDIRNADGSTYNSANDPRVTKVGKIMRKTSIDELPQLLNVFLGHMSLIGPRPSTPKILEGMTPLQAERLKVRPGITGLWQVSGRSDTDYARRVALDSYYVLNWSPWMDIWIFLRTICAVLLMRGAR